MPINRWMDKEDTVHKYNGVLLSHQKEWNNAICSNMDKSGDYHPSEVSQTKTNIIWYYLYVVCKKVNTYEFLYKTEKDSQTYRTNL